MRALCPLVFLLILFSGVGAYALTVDKVLATINNEVITLSDYQLYVDRIGFTEHRETINERILRSLIEEKLILQAAHNEDINATKVEIAESIREFRKAQNITEEEFEVILKDEGISLDTYEGLTRNNILSLKILDREVESKVVVTDEDIHDYYKRNKHLFIRSQDRVEVKALYLKLGDAPTLTEVTSLKIKSLRISAKIQEGEPFDKIVNLYSHSATGSRDRIEGEFKKGELLPVLEAELQKMHEGEVSRPLWIYDGVYIIKLIRRVNAVYAPVEEVRENIYTKLFEERRIKRFNEWMKILWENASVTIE